MVLIRVKGVQGARGIQVDSNKRQRAAAVGNGATPSKQLTTLTHLEASCRHPKSNE